MYRQKKKNGQGSLPRSPIDVDLKRIYSARLNAHENHIITTFVKYKTPFILQDHMRFNKVAWKTLYFAIDNERFAILRQDRTMCNVRKGRKIAEEGPSSDR